MIRAYLDNNATTRPDLEVLAAVRRVEDELYLNPSSAAGEILGAARPISDAKAAMAELLGAPYAADDVVFTSGASEANSWIVAAALAGGGHAVTTAAEHPSVLAACAAAKRRGCEVDVVRINELGLVDLDDLARALRQDTRLVTVHLANNETGVIQPMTAIGDLVRSVAPTAILHTDATQAVGRIDIALDGDLAQVDALSFSAHKFHGPRGMGGLFAREELALEPLIHGEQDRGRRGGTLNAAAAAGLAVAAMLARRGLADMPAVAALRDWLEGALVRSRPYARINSASADRLPNTTSITFPGIRADEVVEALALEGLCISTGSACSAGATAPSHVLTAMGLDLEAARSTLRFSLSRQTRRDEVELLESALAAALKRGL